MSKFLVHHSKFLYRNLYNYEGYEDMKPDSNQPARLYGTAQTSKFKNLEGTTHIHFIQI